MGPAQATLNSKVSIRAAGFRVIDRNAQRGATLLEAIAFLGIAAIVTLGAVSMLSSAFSSADLDKANNELLGLRVAIKKAYSNQGGYGANNANLIETLYILKALPSSLGYDSTAKVAKNGWGIVEAKSKNGSSFVITLNSIPKDSCISVLMGTGPNTWQSIEVEGTAVTLPLSASTAESACNGANKINKIAFEAL
jgi:type II secretory pathway pseudopilin PulG